MKPFSTPKLIIFMIVFLFAVSCRPSAVSPGQPISGPMVTTEPEQPEHTETPADSLPLLPAFINPVPDVENDPFTAVTFSLSAELPSGFESAVVERHAFGEKTEAKARELTAAE